MRARDLNPAWPDRVLLMTNFHVVNRDGAPVAPLLPLRPGQARVRFEVGPLADGARLFRLGAPLFQSPFDQLDCFLAEVKDLPPDPAPLPLGPVPVDPASLPVDAYVVGHPRGGVLQVSATGEAKLTAIEGAWYRYRASTDRGSSGSPVFNRGWEVIALHHAARDTNNDYAHDVNEGVSIHAIRDAVKSIPWPG